MNRKKRVGQSSTPCLCNPLGVQKITLVFSVTPCAVAWRLEEPTEPQGNPDSYQPEKEHSLHLERGLGDLVWWVSKDTRAPGWRLVQLVKHVTLALRVVRSSSTLGIELKQTNRHQNVPPLRGFSATVGGEGHALRLNINNNNNKKYGLRNV